MINAEKLAEFFVIADKLNTELNSVPILYGSLGLSTAMASELTTNDIDLLVEEHIFKNDLNAIHRVMNANGFTLTNPDENEFCKGSIKVGIAHDGDLIAFCDVNPDDLDVIRSPVRYRVLTLANYLKVYSASSKDGYRKEKRMKNDGAKVERIKAALLA